jgi:DNA-binding NtrC family response regulator
MATDKKRTTMITRTILAGAERDLSQQRCILVQVEGPEAGKKFSIDSTQAVVGKSPDVDIPVADITVSRKHFKVINEKGRYLLKDLGSTNGTLLDGAQVKEAYLRPGALIKAGEVVFRFQTEYDPVQIQPSEEMAFGGLVGRSLRMREIFALLQKIARTDSTILILGNTGTGKGAAAGAIHQHSKQKKGPLVVVDCGSIAGNLIESELFGHVKGAFTGAVSTRKGALEESKGGTLFIDELDDLPLDLQPKLLRAIEERVFVRLGSNKPIKFDARIVAASKKDLWKEVAANRFREDLYFRLSVVSLRLPPLRDRVEDIPLLYDQFLNGRAGRFSDLPQDVQNRWLNHDWPGNVRELRNAIERSLALDGDGLLGGPQTSNRPTQVGGLAPDYSMPFKQAKERLLDVFEYEYIKRLMARSKGGVAGAARMAEIDRKYLYKLLQKHGFSKADKSE